MNVTECSSSHFQCFFFLLALYLMDIQYKFNSMGNVFKRVRLQYRKEVGEKRCVSRGISIKLIAHHTLSCLRGCLLCSVRPSELMRYVWVKHQGLPEDRSGAVRVRTFGLCCFNLTGSLETWENEGSLIPNWRLCDLFLEYNAVLIIKQPDRFKMW